MTTRAPQPTEDGAPLSPSGFVVRCGRKGRIRTIVPTGTCTWCGDVVKKPRRTWCSDECVDRYNHTQPGVLRGEVGKRDNGLCSLCGLDTVRLRKIWRRWLTGQGAWPLTTVVQTADGVVASRCRRADGRVEYGPRSDIREFFRVLRRPVPDRARLFRATWWEADHSVPIAEGGDPFDLSNLRTLCWWCHKSETTDLAGRLARSKKRQRELFAGMT